MGFCGVGKPYIGEKKLIKTCKNKFSLLIASFCLLFPIKNGLEKRIFRIIPSKQCFDVNKSCVYSELPCWHILTKKLNKICEIHFEISNFIFKILSNFHSLHQESQTGGPWGSCGTFACFVQSK